MKRKALRAAFPHTLPIMAGFLFLGAAYGIYMKVLGFEFYYPMIMSLTIFAGSVEFVVANLLLGAFHPIQVLLMTLILNARHLFYGISMLERFQNTGWKKYYLIFGMCDESFSVNYTADIPKDIDSGWFMFFVTFLNHIYWFVGATLGGVFGSVISFNTEGLEFVMTAMFVVIFMEQWMKDEKHSPTVLGIGISFLCLGIFGAEYFMIPSMIGILAVLTWMRDHWNKIKQKIRKEGRYEMSIKQQIIMILMAVAGTMLTRFFPFLLFPSGKETPKYIQYLGKVLPAAVFGMLVVYCLKNVSIFTGNHALPEILAIGLVIVSYLWKRQMLLSIASGTMFYMFLIQVVF